MSVNELVRLWKDPEARWESGVDAPHPAGEIVVDLAKGGAQADLTWTALVTGCSVSTGRSDRL